jgi:hypothetical protein
MSVKKGTTAVLYIELNIQHDCHLTSCGDEEESERNNSMRGRSCEAYIHIYSPNVAIAFC